MSNATWVKPTRPYSVIDAINRYAASTGSARYAALAANSDYNGHRVSVTFNDYRGYWIAEYFWAGRHVLARGTIEACLHAAVVEYDRGALGASVVAHPRTPEEIVACQQAGLVAETDAPDAWVTDLHREVPNAFALERHGLGPAVGLLANSTSLADYHAKLDAITADRRNARRA